LLPLIVNDESSNATLDGSDTDIGFSFGSLNHQPGFSIDSGLAFHRDNGLSIGCFGFSSLVNGLKGISTGFCIDRLHNKETPKRAGKK